MRLVRIGSIAIGVIVAFAAPTLAQDVQEGISVTYRCAGGVALQTAYINTPDGNSYVVVGHDGRLVPMEVGPTGSGVRYVSLDESKLVWHTKGKDGFLALDDSAETMLVQGCVAAD